MAGVTALRTLADLPSAPDAAFIAVNRHAAVDAVRELAEMGAGGAVCFASGFLEAGAADADAGRLNARLVEAAGSMPLIGPNCYGLINYVDGALLWPDQHGGRRLAGNGRGVAIVTQSSNIAINMTMQRRGLPIAYVVTAGNQAQTGLSQIALALIEDDRVSALGLHVEGFDSVAGFQALAARARQLRKPVVAIKAGRSEQASAATISHTASLAGSDAACEAFLCRLGMARANTVPSFLETLKLLHVTGTLDGHCLSSMSCSGGEAVMMADAAAGRLVRFPPLAPAHREKLLAALGPLVAIANPLDYHTFIWNDVPAMTAAFSAMIAGGFDLNMLVLDFPRADRCSDEDWWPAVDAFESALKANGAAGAVVASMQENLPEDHCEQLMARGLAPIAGIAEAVDAAEAAAFIGKAWRGNAPLPLCPVASGAGEPARELARLDEAQAKSLLSAEGISVPAGHVVNTEEEAVCAATRLGFPVALKALGPAHKSENHAVRLNLGTAAAVRSAAADLAGKGSALFVEEMIGGALAELIVAVTHDPLFGPVMTIGSGGILVELLCDTRTLLLPAGRDEIRATLSQLRLFALLEGYRGRPKGDLEAAIGAIHAVSQFACANADRLVELEVNPLIICSSGAFAADALMVVRGDPGHAPASGEMEET